MKKGNKTNKSFLRSGRGRFVSATPVYKNNNAKIVNTPLKTGSGNRTRTTGRDDDSLNVSIVSRSSGGTTLKIFSPTYAVSLSGTEARTLYRVLEKHFDNQV
jgi:hypothetical protein